MEVWVLKYKKMIEIDLLAFISKNIKLLLYKIRC